MHRLAAAGRMGNIDFVPPPPVPAEQLHGLFTQLYQPHPPPGPLSRSAWTGGEWEESGASFEWELHPGRNRLRARAVNTMGLRGPENRVELEYRPGS